jgi:hypothetical protein
MWRAMTGDKQVFRLKAAISTELTRQLEADDGSHAMPEKSERRIEQRKESVGNRFDERLKPSERLLAELVLSSRKLNRANLYRGRETFRPCAVKRGSASRIRKAEQA